MGVEGIILAAGLSSRVNAFKMTLKLGDKTIIEHVIDNMLVVCKRVIVVGGHKIEELAPIIENYSNAELVFNEGFMDGMFSSVKKGLSCLKGDKFFITPGDYPLIGPEVYREIARYDGDIVIPTYQERKGHPVLFKSIAAEEILREGKYSNLREYIQAKRSVLVPVNCSGILKDIDTVEDYEELKRYIKS